MKLRRTDRYPERALGDQVERHRAQETQEQAGYDHDQLMGRLWARSEGRNLRGRPSARLDPERPLFHLLSRAHHPFAGESVVAALLHREAALRPVTPTWSVLVCRSVRRQDAWTEPIWNPVRRR